MNNGCVCCTVRGDLVTILDGLMKRKGKFDAIIVETTGLADPAPVAQTFFVDEDVKKNARLDAVVTVADAKWLSDRLKDAPEAKNQIAFADVIVLNKTDLVSKAELAEVEARIRGINPYAKLHRTERCKVALADVLERGAFDLDRILEIEPEFLDAGDGQIITMTTIITAMTIIRSRPQPWRAEALPRRGHAIAVAAIGQAARPDQIYAVAAKPRRTEGQKILRSKGILSFADDDDRYVFQGVHMMLEGDHQREWKDGEARKPRRLHGRELPEQMIREGFESCIVT